MLNKEILSIQKSIADKENDLKKMVEYTINLSSYIRDADWESSKFDVDSGLIRIEFYKCMFNSTKQDIKKLKERLYKCRDKEEMSGTEIESINLSIKQTEMLEEQIVQNEMVLSSLENSLTSYTETIDESKRIDEAIKLKDFQAKINELR